MLYFPTHLQNYTFYDPRCIQIMFLDTTKLYRHTITDPGIGLYLVASGHISTSTEPETVDRDPPQGIIVSPMLRITLIVPDVSPNLEPRMKADCQYY